MGKLLISHRSTIVPLLSSESGGLNRSWSYKTYPWQSYYNFFSSQEIYFNFNFFAILAGIISLLIKRPVVFALTNASEA